MAQPFYKHEIIVFRDFPQAQSLKDICYNSELMKGLPITLEDIKTFLKVGFYAINSFSLHFKIEIIDNTKRKMTLSVFQILENRPNICSAISGEEVEYAVLLETLVSENTSLMPSDFVPEDEDHMI